MKLSILSSQILLMAMSLNQMLSFCDKTFIEWYGKSIKSNSSIFIMDYELKGELVNGLELLRSINPGNRGFLITSHAEKSSFQKSAEELGFWLIPKCLVSEILINKIVV